MSSKSVLAISSHVAHGYVGNKAIVFPLQCQGWEVDNIDTVNFSNHTGYGTFQGNFISGSLLTKLTENVPKPEFLITGYVPNDELIAIVVAFIARLKKSGPTPIYLFDPVLGDEGVMYVNHTCVNQYRQLVRSGLVDIITPNQFELELLTDIKINSVADIVRSIDLLKEFGIKFIVITSLRLPPFANTLEDAHASHSKFIYCFVATQNTRDVRYFKVPLINSYFTGVGDIFSGLLLSRLYNCYYSQEAANELAALSDAVSQVLSIMSHLLAATNANGLKYCTHAHINDLNIKHFELNLIESKHLYSSDERLFEPFTLDMKQ